MDRALRIVNTADCLFTVLLHLTVGHVEANPVMGGLIAISWPLFVVVKLVGVALLSHVLAELKQRLILAVLTVLVTIAAAANAVLLIVSQ